MKKSMPYVLFLVVLLAWVVVSGTPQVRRESELFALSDSAVAAIGEHNYHKFYNNTEHGRAADGRSGEVTQTCGLIGGISELGTLTAEADSTLSLRADARKGRVRCILQQAETAEIVFSGILSAEAETLAPAAGTYRVLLVADNFSGSCTLAYENAAFERE